MNLVRWPAEWEPQAFVQLTFPHAATDWNPILEQATRCFLTVAEALLRFVPVVVVVPEGTDLKLVHPNLRIFRAPTNDTWARDHGGIVVLQEGKPVVLDFVFNGWGGKFEAAHDNQITAAMYKAGFFGKSELKQVDMVLEGGSIESDGQGTILTTSACLLNANRNPTFSRLQIEEQLKTYLGAERILWLENGYLEGDDTDAHVDTLARFCDENTIAYVSCDDASDSHFESLRKMECEIQNLRTRSGQPYRLVRLPMCSPICDDKGNRLPATYANFLITNGAVLVPVYGTEQDKIACDTLASVFPGREIVPIDCRALISQHGSLHCITMQYPAVIM